MGTNRKRKMRISKNKIPSNLTAKYLGELCADAFLGKELTEEEDDLVREYEKCGRDFEKWKKFRGGKK